MLLLAGCKPFGLRDKPADKHAEDSAGDDTEPKKQKKKSIWPQNLRDDRAMEVERHLGNGL
jgi:hypothetical protein